MDKSFSVYEQYNNGIPIYKIKKSTNLTRQNILEILYENGINLTDIKIKLTNEEQEQIIKLYENGVNPTNIGIQIKKSTSCIRDFLIIKGFKIISHDLIKRLSIKDKNNIIEMFRDGRPISNIAHEYKTNSISIKRLLLNILPESELNKIKTYKEKNIICKKCNKKCYNYQSFSKHLKNEHNMNLKQYYDVFLRKPGNGVCIICGKSSKRFISLDRGYGDTCCKSCAAKQHRAKLRKDKQKFEKFRQRVSKHRIEWFANLSDEEINDFKNKVSKGINEFVSQLSDNDKKKKFGWMNKLSPKQRHDYVANVLLQTGCHKWWKNSNDKQKKDVYAKRRKTVIESKGFDFDEYIKTIKFQKDLYSQRVRTLTETTYKKHKNKINPLNRNRSKNWQIDHKFSISEGFRNNIDPEIMSHYVNLQMLTGLNNNKKNDKCSITKEELINNYEKEKAL